MESKKVEMCFLANHLPELGFERKKILYIRREVVFAVVCQWDHPSTRPSASHPSTLPPTLTLSPLLDLFLLRNNTVSLERTLAFQSVTLCNKDRAHQNWTILQLFDLFSYINILGFT